MSELSEEANENLLKEFDKYPLDFFEKKLEQGEFTEPSRTFATQEIRRRRAQEKEEDRKQRTEEEKPLLQVQASIRNSQWAMVAITAVSVGVAIYMAVNLRSEVSYIRATQDDSTEKRLTADRIDSLRSTLVGIDSTISYIDTVKLSGIYTRLDHIEKEYTKQDVELESKIRSNSNKIGSMLTAPPQKPSEEGIDASLHVEEDQTWQLGDTPALQIHAFIWRLNYIGKEDGKTKLFGSYSLEATNLTNRKIRYKYSLTCEDDLGLRVGGFIPIFMEPGMGIEGGRVLKPRETSEDGSAFDLNVQAIDAANRISKCSAHVYKIAYE